MIAGIASLKPRLGDVSDLSEQLVTHFEAAGFECTRFARVADRGDGRPGTLDLLCQPVPRQAGLGSVAIEIDAGLPRGRSVMKLRRLGDGVLRVIVLRTGDARAPVSGIDHVIPLGWPGSPVVSPAVSPEQMRAAVGLAAPAASQGSAEEPSAASVRRVFASVRAQLDAMGLPLPTMIEFDGFFAEAAYERHEVLESGVKLLVLAAPNPAETQRGLNIYWQRLEREMTAAFGCRMAVQVVAGDSS